MRIHISLDDDLIAELDRRAGKRQRSAFISRMLERALAEERRWEEIEASLGSIADDGHEWDRNAGQWVSESRRADQRRVG